MTQVMPNFLIKIVEFLKKSPMTLSKQSQDGRIKSTFNENEIFKCPKSSLATNPPNMCSWIDFSFEGNNSFYPVNTQQKLLIVLTANLEYIMPQRARFHLLAMV